MGKSWKNPIKAAQAAKKGKLFTKLAREISMAAKLGGPDPESNPRLSLAIKAAKAESVPKDTMDRAIKKGAGLEENYNIEELTYEGFAPHQVGVIVECQSDNRNRTVSDLRALFKKAGGELGQNGCVTWMFEKVSLIEGQKENVEDPEVDAIETGANEVEAGQSEGTWAFYGAPEDLDQIQTALKERGWDISVAELSFKPTQFTELNEEQKQDVHDLLDKLEDFDDSHRVHASLK